MTITNYHSGEINIATKEGPSIRLPREAANRLIMMARMHSVDEFKEKLPTLIPNSGVSSAILKAFDVPDSTDRWNLKEKFARLQTLTKDFQPENPDEVWEAVTL